MEMSKFAAESASRSVTAPSMALMSSALVTVMVARRVRCSRVSAATGQPVRGRRSSRVRNTSPNRFMNLFTTNLHKRAAMTVEQYRSLMCVYADFSAEHVPLCANGPWPHPSGGCDVLDRCHQRRRGICDSLTTSRHLQLLSAQKKSPGVSTSGEIVRPGGARKPTLSKPLRRRPLCRLCHRAHDRRHGLRPPRDREHRRARDRGRLHRDHEPWQLRTPCRRP